MWESEALVNGTDVGHAVPGVDDDAGEEALRVEGQHGLRRESKICKQYGNCSFLFLFKHCGSNIDICNFELAKSENI